MAKKNTNQRDDLQKLFAEAAEFSFEDVSPVSKDGKQLELAFSLPYYSYDVKISDLSIHNARGFEHLGYFSSDIKHFDQIRKLIHKQCVDRWFWYGMNLYQWIFKDRNVLHPEELKSANYRIMYAIRHFGGYYLKVEQYSEFWFENGKIVGNRSKCVILGSYDPNEKYPPTIIVQTPIIFVAGKRRNDLEGRLLDEVSGRHIEKLGFKPSEIKIMRELKNDMNAKLIAKKLNCSTFHIQDTQKVILAKARTEYEGFKTAKEVALFYSNYKMC